MPDIPIVLTKHSHKPHLLLLEIIQDRIESHFALALGQLLFIEHKDFTRPIVLIFNFVLSFFKKPNPIAAASDACRFANPIRLLFAVRRFE